MGAGSLKGAVAILAILAAILWSAATAVAQAPFDSPGKTDRIELVASMPSGGYQWELYRNLAYPCSISGFQTFAVATRLGSSPDAPRPLWVRMRGGGVGYFNAAGQPLPSQNNKTEDDLARLTEEVSDNELNQLVNADSAEFRTVSVSMCDHDIYAGGDQPDPNNPNLTPDGQPRTTNGLFATKAAIQFVQERYPTTKTFLHGTSAGSFGTWGLAWSLEREDRPVTGFVADSGVLNIQSELDQQAAMTPCARPPEALAGVNARIHPELADPANEPDRLISRGALTAPVYNVWSRDDNNVCGSLQIPCTMRDGTIQTMGGAECRFAPISAAIAALPASRQSVNAQLCVSAKKAEPGDCSNHVVTNDSAAEFPNTDPAFPADYNAEIMSWVRERLGDRAPELDVKLGKRSKLEVRRGRVAVRCRSGGSGKRTCRVDLRSLGAGKDRVVARGKDTIRTGSASGEVRVKLTRAGRRLVRDGSRRGIRVRARARVGEQFTGRRGETSRRLRLR